MMNENAYPPFDPPDELAKDPKTWTRTEARAYLTWLTDQIEPRSRAVLEYLGVADRSDHAVVLTEVGACAVEVLRSPTFSRLSEGLKPMILKGREIQYDRGPELTSSGLALAADLGLLTARYLMADFGDRVRWEVGKGRRSWVWYNRPILTGGGINPFDPTGVSVSNAYGILRGSRDQGVWASLYRHAAADLDGSGTGS